MLLPSTSLLTISSTTEAGMENDVTTQHLMCFLTFEFATLFCLSQTEDGSNSNVESHTYSSALQVAGLLAHAWGRLHVSHLERAAGKQIHFLSLEDPQQCVH